MWQHVSIVGLTIGIVFSSGAASRADAAPAGPALEQTHPTVVFCPPQDIYLAFWTEDRGQGADIYAKRLFANGLPQGGATRGGVGVMRRTLGSPTPARRDPAVVYNPDVEEFYLVWSEENTDQGEDIYGVRLTSAAFARGDPRLLVTGPGDQTHPAIAYNAEQQAYLLVWEDNARDIDEIWGLRLRSNGIPFGPAFPVAQVQSNAEDPTVARRADGYLVAWADDRVGNSDIFARRLNGNGLPIGGTQGEEYAMASSPVDEIAPSLDPSSGTLVYNVYDPLTGLDIVGVRVYDSGTTRGQRSVGIAIPAADQANPATAQNASRGETLVVFQDNRSGEFDIYAVRVRNSRPSGRDYAILTDGFVR